MQKNDLGGTLICSGCFQPNRVSKIFVYFTLLGIQTSVFEMVSYFLRMQNISKYIIWILFVSFDTLCN